VRRATPPPGQASQLPLFNSPATCCTSRHLSFAPAPPNPLNPPQEDDHKQKKEYKKKKEEHEKEVGA
jgi:hypothetical protein